VPDECLLQLHQTRTQLRVLVLEGLGERLFLAVDQHRHPRLLVVLVFGLEVIGPIVADQVEALLLVRHRLDLARQQIDARRWLGLIRMANVQKTVFGYSTTSLLPHPPHFAFALLVQMAGTCHTMQLVALQLMQAVRCSFVGHNILQLKER